MNEKQPHRFVKTQLLRVAGLSAIAALLAVGVVACGESETTSPTVASESGSQNDPTTPAPSKGDSFKVRSGAVTGYVDSVTAEGESVSLTGWAASGDLKKAAQTVSGKVDGKAVAEAVPLLERSDVASIYNKPALKMSGFQLRVPTAELNCSSPAAGLAVYGVLDGVGSELEFVENTDTDLREAC